MSSVDPGRYASGPGVLGRSHSWVGARKSNHPVMSTATSGWAKGTILSDPVIELMTVSPDTNVELAMKYRSPPDTSAMPSRFKSAVASGDARVTDLSSVKSKLKFRSTYTVSYTNGVVESTRSIPTFSP